MEDSAHSIFHPLPRKFFVGIGNIFVPICFNESAIAEAIESALRFYYFVFNHGVRLHGKNPIAIKLLKNFWGGGGSTFRKALTL
jgi:hypothetical protein